MPPTHSATLAARLLRFSPTSEVTDALLNHTATTPGLEVHLAAEPSQPVALSMLRDRAQVRALLSAPVTDPDVLTALATMRNIDARRAAAANPHTPTHLLDALVIEAKTKNDEKMMAALCATTDPLEWIRHTRGSIKFWQYGSPAVVNVTAQLERRHDPRLTRAVFLEALTENLENLEAAIAVSTAQGRQPVTLSELDSVVSVHGAGAYKSFYTELITRYPQDAPFAEDLAERLAAWLDGTPFVGGVTQRMLTSARPASRRVMDILVGSGHSDLGLAALNAHVDGIAYLEDEHLTELAGTDSPALAERLLEQAPVRARLSRSQVEHLTAKCLYTDALTRTLFEARDAHRLSATAQANLLRNAHSSTVASWVNGELGLGPRPEVAAQLASSRGTGTPRLASGPQLSRVDVFLMQQRAHITVAALQHPDVRALLDAAPRAVLFLATDMSCEDNAFLAYLGERVTARFGTSHAAWAALPTLAKDLTALDTVTDLLDTVRALSETDAPRLPAPADRIA